MSETTVPYCSRCWGPVEVVRAGGTTRVVCVEGCGWSEPLPAAVEVRAAGTPLLPGIEEGDR